jgi:hypothetical protein
MILFRELNKEKANKLPFGFGIFYFHSFATQAGVGLFFVDKRFEISNFDLIKDMVSIFELREIFTDRMNNKSSLLS